MFETLENLINKYDDIIDRKKFIIKFYSVYIFFILFNAVIMSKFLVFHEINFYSLYFFYIFYFPTIGIVKSTNDILTKSTFNITYSNINFINKLVSICIIELFLCIIPIAISFLLMMIFPNVLSGFGFCGLILLLISIPIFLGKGVQIVSSLLK